jgi:hypothetical protein
MADALLLKTKLKSKTPTTLKSITMVDLAIVL